MDKKMKFLTTALFLVLISTGICYAGKALTAQQKEAQEWVERGDQVETSELEIEYYTKAIELNPELAVAYKHRGFAYYDLDFPTAACDDFYQAGLLYLKQKKPGFAFVCLGNLKSIEEATPLYLKEAGPSSPLIEKLTDKICDCYYSEALTFLNQNNRTKALECIDMMKKVDPSSPLIKKLMDKIYGENNESKSTTKKKN